MLSHSWLGLQVAAGTLTGVACGTMAVLLLLALLRRRDLSHLQRWSGLLAGLFVLACGLTQLLDVVMLWQPLTDLQDVVKVLAALLALGLAITVLPSGAQNVHALLQRPLNKAAERPYPGLIADLRNRLGLLDRRLAEETDARKMAQASLAYTQAVMGEEVQTQVEARLDAQVSERTQGLRQMQRRFKEALNAANVMIYNQDRALRYTWLSGPDAYGAEDVYLGKTDAEIAGPAVSAPVMALKQRALASGRPQEGDIMLRPYGRARWFRLHVQPLFQRAANDEDDAAFAHQTPTEEGAVIGITCVAVDITMMKALEQEQIRLNAELAAGIQRYQLALESSKMIVFTQDRELVYTSISREMLGLQPEEFIGRADEEILPVTTANLVIPLKQRVLQSGQPAHMEIPLHHNGQVQWVDLYINPLKDVGGRTTGLTCAALDITERKGWEEHLRLLMREVTHRSKNLLAVIQAMARQTARGADSVDGFVERFSARLQALGGAHDLLVRESWHGVNMPDLIRSQLGHYADLVGSQIVMEGPNVFMTPEAAQNLGMALHEMATNAAKYGALSRQGGQVSITWDWQAVAEQSTEESEASGTRLLQLKWLEMGGPAAKASERAGFGTHVIQRNLVRSLSAKVNLDYGVDGFKAAISIPGSALMTRSLAGNTPVPVASTVPTP